MKINEILAEGWKDVASNLGKDFFGIDRSQSWTGPQGLVPGLNKPKAAPVSQPAAPIPDSSPDDDVDDEPMPRDNPAIDIKDTLDDNTQYRFPNPEYPGIQIIVRKSGWYLDQLPADKRGKVNRDKATKLFPVLLPANIARYNRYYDQAADAGKVVREEPTAAL